MIFLLCLGPIFTYYGRGLWHALFAYVAEVVTYVTNSQQFCEQFEITEQFMGYLVISN